MNLTLHLRSILDDLRSSLWYRPAIYTVLAVILALVAPYIDQLTTWQFYDIGADNARAVLLAIASSMLTVVTLTFSILMVSFTLASQQFSPRILRNFTRDQASQHVMGLQVGTFLYSLLVMVRVNEAGDEPFVPLLSVVGAIGFSMLGIGAFIYFIDHISRSIRVNYIIANIGEQTVALLHSETPAHLVSAQQAVPAALFPADAAVLSAQTAGYVQGMDTTRLIDLAQAHDLMIELACQTGDFIVRGRPLLHVYPGAKLTPALSDALHNQFDIGTERTLFEDVLFGIRQLVDIAIKALSPAVNDPTTAVNCLDYLTNILVQAAQLPKHHAHYYDSAGTPRLLVHKVSFEAMVELAFNQIRHYGCGDVLVDIRMIDALTEIATATADRERRALLWRYVTMISRTTDRTLDDPHDRGQVNECLARAAEQMGYSATTVFLERAAEPHEVG